MMNEYENILETGLDGGRHDAESRSTEISVITEMSALGRARDSEFDHL